MSRAKGFRQNLVLLETSREYDKPSPDRFVAFSKYAVPFVVVLVLVWIFTKLGMDFFM